MINIIQMNKTRNVLYLIFLLFNFQIINSQNIEVNILSFDDIVNKINEIKYLEQDYLNIISNITELLDYYVYLDIAKNPPHNLKKVDLIKEIKSINITNIKLYDFYLNISNILFSVLDAHLRISFKQFNNYEYYSPVYYFTKTENNINYLFLDINPDNYLNIPFDKKLISNIKKNKKYKIIKINEQDPYDYIQNFGKKIFKSDHAQYTYNINKYIRYGNFSDYPFIKKDLENITITFENNESISFDYKIIYNKNKNYKIISPKYNLKWTSNYENKIKYKLDKDKKVNVIYQSSFDIKEYDNKIDFFFRDILNDMNQNDYPIIIIEDFNNGGNIMFSYIIQTLINYNLSNIKSRESFRISEKLGIALQDNFNLFDLKTCQKIELNTLIRNKETDNYNNKIKHNRTKIVSVYNTFNHIKSKTKYYKKQKRKPTEIIIFTDGFSYSATSYFIKDMQESGNAILIGYNGNPSEKRKKDLFDASQSPSASMSEINRIFVSNLKKYGIEIEITIGESFNDNFQNENNMKIPREYIINPIDERSNIYDKYDDSRYDEFINEGLRIVNKYKNECNSNNKKLLLINDKCKFGNFFTHGGFLCDDNGKWSNFCQASYCDDGYFFDNFYNVCKRDSCFHRNIINVNNSYLKKNFTNKNFISSFYNLNEFFLWFFFVIIFMFFIFLIYFKCRKKKNKKDFGIELEDKLV